MREGLTWRFLALILLAFCVPLFIGLGATDLENDEAIYSYAVDSILETGDWLSPRSSPREDITFLEKPPLKFWIVAAPIRLGLLPHDEFGLRFWDAVFGCAAFVYVFLIGRRLSGPLAGVVAVLVLFAHHRLLYDHGLRSNNMEAALVLAYCGGVYHFLRYIDRGGARGGREVAAVAALFYLGFMCKFVAALFLPGVLGAVALAVPAWRRQAWDDRWRWLAATAAVLAAVIPWFAYQHVMTRGTIWRVMFGEHVFTRFTAYADPQHLQPWHFYFSEVFRQLQHSGATLLVALGLAVLIVDVVRRRWPEGALVLAWFAVPVALISLGTSKLYHYVYPFLPPLALAAGYGVAWLVSHAAPALARALSRRGIRMPAAREGLVQDLLMLAAIGALGVAVATAAHGQIRVSIGGELLFRNSSVLRPLFLAAAFAALAGRAGGAMVTAAVLGLALVVPLPLKGYVSNIEALTAERQALRTLSACLREVDDARRAAGDAVHGVYGLSPEDGGFLHQYFYYLRRAGGWTERSDEGDAAIAQALSGPSGARPLALDSHVYAAFLDRRPPTGTLPPGVRLGSVVVVLPEPYNRCATALAGARH